MPILTIYSGFMTGQIDFYGFLDDMRKTMLLVDPVMGDDGSDTFGWQKGPMQILPCLLADYDKYSDIMCSCRLRQR